MAAEVCCGSNMGPPQAERKAAKGGEKAHGVCCPGRDTAVRRKSFLSYFLYFTKSRTIAAARRRSVAAGNPKRRHGRRKRGHRAAKGFNWAYAKL